MLLTKPKTSSQPMPLTTRPSRSTATIIDEENPRGCPGRFFKVEDCRMNWSLEPEKVHNRCTGKLQFVFGNYSDRKVFKQSQARAGDFDYEAIVVEVEDRMVKSRAQKIKHAKEEAGISEGQDIRDRLVREFYPDLKDAEGIQTVPQGEPLVLQTTSEGGLKFAVSKPIKEEQLRELLATCKRVGVF